MKLIKEITTKIIIFIFIFAIHMEALILILILFRSSQILNKTYKEIIEKTESKAIEITKQVVKYGRYIFMRYNTDLILIGKHIYLLNGYDIYDSERAINNESHIFNLNNKIKNIIPAKLEELINIDYMKKIFNGTFQRFDYLNKYEKDFNNIHDNNLILKTLFSNSHQELNSISYYSTSKNESTEENTIKFIITILKSIYIRRYIRKRINMDYIHFLIIYEDEIYIYPPETYNNINFYGFADTYRGIADCNYTSENKSQQFPLCAYNYITNELGNINHLIMIFEGSFFERIFAAFCMKIPFIKNNKKKAILCVEIDLSLFFSEANFNNPNNFEFGMITYGKFGITPIIYNRKDLYQDIINTFNENCTVSEKYIIKNIISGAPIFSLFHFLYYNLTKIANEHSELNVNFTEIEEEYKTIENKIILEIEEYLKNQTIDKIQFSFNKTICRKGLLVNNYECVKDEFEMIIMPLIFNISTINEYFYQSNETVDVELNMFIYSIISTNPNTNNEKISTIANIKLKRTIVLYFFLTIIILAFFILLINLISEYSLNQTNSIINQLNKVNLKGDTKLLYSLKEDRIFTPNKEILNLNNIYESMKKTMIIKQAFEVENYLNKYNLEFYNLIQDIDKINIKEICNSFLGFYHYKNNAYNLAEKEFNSTINFIIDNENKAASGKNSEYEDKIKDAIKRSSTVSYLNEFSEFEKIEENFLSIINLKIFKQRFMYLYAMTKFKLGSEINSNNNNLNTGTTQNKSKSKKVKNKRITYFKEAIKYFNECKNINDMLGINQIKIIYCLIMISKCYIQLNDYKYSMTNINEALTLFFEFSKSFKDYHSKNYNPKIMLFVENNIFHYILFTFQRICYSFNKTFASNWIALKLFETSPFILNNVHYHSGLILQNYLDRNKLKLNKADSKFLNSTFLLKEYEKTKKYYSKIIQRMNVKNINNRNIRLKIEKMIGDSSYSTSYQNKTESRTEKSLLSSTFKRELVTGRTSTSFHSKNKNRNKIITLCLSEKILEKVNGLELKDLIVKYFQKFFIMNENDKFSFVQFANNGKKTVYFKPEQLDYFLLKIQKAKNSFELTDSFLLNSNSPFMELYNILYSIIVNYPINDNIDNIIIMFINANDIRFTSIKECLNIVEELNKKNTSLFILTYDEEIKREKINNIQSFLNGLSEGYFFQIKNYQQLKQFFVNISSIKYQSNFFGYDFNCLDNDI